MAGRSGRSINRCSVPRAERRDVVVPVFRADAHDTAPTARLSVAPQARNYRSTMDPVTEELVMFGSPAGTRGLDWPWVDEQLLSAGAYWTVTPSEAHPHPRPVWGVWLRNVLFLSIGSPRLKADAQDDMPVTVHLGSVTDVVIVEGLIAGQNSEREVLDAYNAKYDWDYTVDEYGPFTTVAPVKVVAWRSAGWAGREGFQQTGKWRFDTPRS